jgi:membrane protease YdiL (CAAX protease family)
MTGHPLAYGELGFVIAVSWCAIGFTAYYFLSRSKTFVNRIGILVKTFDSQGNQVILQRMLGLIFLGIVSSLIILGIPGMALKDYGLSFSFSALPPWWSFLLIPLILGLGSITAGSSRNLAMYPQIRLKNWTPRPLLISAISWILFLIGYEFLFRGFLLNASLDLMNPLPAFALNVALYALAHAYKGPGETYGSIPVGIVLCYLTLITGNIWCAVILHSIMALSNEWLSIRAHPEMKISLAS